MRLVMNPVPAWKAASGTRRALAVVLYAVAAATLAYSLYNFPPLGSASASWVQFFFLLVGAYFLFDIAHIALRGSKAREQVVDSLRRKPKGR